MAAISFWAGYALFSVFAHSVFIYNIQTDGPDPVALVCSDRALPQVNFYGDEHIGWITAVGCGSPPNHPHGLTPEGCKGDFSLYTKPIVDITPRGNGTWTALIYCSGDKPTPVS